MVVVSPMHEVGGLLKNPTIHAPGKVDSPRSCLHPTSTPVPSPAADLGEWWGHFGCIEQRAESRHWGRRRGCHQPQCHSTPRAFHGRSWHLCPPETFLRQHSRCGWCPAGSACSCPGLRTWGGGARGELGGGVELTGSALAGLELAPLPPLPSSSKGRLEPVNWLGCRGSSSRSSRLPFTQPNFSGRQVGHMASEASKMYTYFAPAGLLGT